MESYFPGFGDLRFTQKYDFRNGFKIGVEREALRCTEDGCLALTPHPNEFGCKLTNPYITTDFSESQIELVTPPCNSIRECMSWLKVLTNITLETINKSNEYLWPFSMPCAIPENEKIPIASYNCIGNSKKKSMTTCSKGRENLIIEGEVAHEYRNRLSKKYSSARQVICGIHVNFSIDASIAEGLIGHMGLNSTDDIYLKIARNFTKYYWFLIHMLNSSNAAHSTYIEEISSSENSPSNPDSGCCSLLETSISQNSDASAPVLIGSQKNSTYLAKCAKSIRNSSCGYANKESLYLDYSHGVSGYVNCIKKYVEEGLISSHKELYSPLRLKARDPKNFLESLEKNGILYIEVRPIDIDPFSFEGISEHSLELTVAFLYMCLFLEEEKGNTSDKEKNKDGNEDPNFINRRNYIEGKENANKVATDGLCENLELTYNENSVPVCDYAKNILHKVQEISRLLDLKYEFKCQCIIKDTLPYRVDQFISENNGIIYAGINLAKNYRVRAINEKFFFEPAMYLNKNVELSTQILLKSAVKYGLKVDFLDISDNFISIQDPMCPDSIQYIKQATKTSLDSYVAMLLMENKKTTKALLENAGFNVPKTIIELRKEVFSSEYLPIETATAFKRLYDQTKNRPCVIKPKSTNFGLGINIFSHGITEESQLYEALNYSFKFDDFVFVEEYCIGREYRFTVLGEDVYVLYRDPANIIGDGTHTINELIAEKNKDPRRGVHHVKPLEKIALDDAAYSYMRTTSWIKLYQNGQVKLNRFNSTTAKLSNDDISNSVLGEGVKLYLRENSNISTGGDSIDVTDKMPDFFKKVALDACKALKVKICGVDIMIPSFETNDYNIIEMNFNPAIHIHTYPFDGVEREPAYSVLRSLNFFE